MRTFIIERELPGIGDAEPEKLRAAARKSSEALRQSAPDVQWIQSCVAGDRAFCLDLAENEDAIRKHVELSGRPADTITGAGKIIDPTTARA